MIYTNLDKWGTALAMGLLYLAMSSPYAYQATNYIASKFGYRTANDFGCPILMGIAIHALVFMLIVKLMLNYKGVSKVSNKSEWSMAFMAGLLFALISSSYFNGLIKSVFSQCQVLGGYGDEICLNVETLLVNSGLFALSTRLLM